MQVLKSLQLGVKLLASTTALSLVLGGAAYAVDADTVTARLKSIYSKQGGELSFDSVDTVRSSIFLRGTKAKLASVSDKPFLIGDVTLDDVEDLPDGGIKIGQISVPDQSINADSDDKDADKATFEGIVFENVVLPAENAKGALNQIIFYDRASVDKIQFGDPALNGAAFEGVEATFNRNADTQLIEFSFNVDQFNLKLDEETTSSPENPLADFGMNELSASIASSGNWSPESGKASLENFELDIEELGKLSMTAQIGGYDLAFYEAMQKTQSEMTKIDADATAAGMAALGLAEQLTIKEMSLRFDDASLTGRILDYYAKQQGSDAATLTEQIKMTVPFLAAQLNNMEFAKAVKQATERYFDNPKSLTLSASPEQAVSIASIVATATADPTKLIQLLNLGIVANK